MAFLGTEIFPRQLLADPAMPRLEQMRTLEAMTGKHCAVVDACKIMGKKKFYHQIMEDERLFQKFKITDEIDIVTLKDYMQVPFILIKSSTFISALPTAKSN